MKIVSIDDIDGSVNELATAWGHFPPEAIPEGFMLEQVFSRWRRYGGVESPRSGFKKSPLILLIYDGENLTAILPLMRVERCKMGVLRVSSLEFLTQTFAGGYLDLIHDRMPVERVRCAFKLIHRQFRYDLINLCYLKKDSVLLQAGIGKTCYHSGKVVIPLDMGYERIRSLVYSKNLRHVLNKFHRRIGEAREGIHSEVIEDRKNIIKIQCAIKKVSLSKLNDPGMHSIYQNPMLGETYFDSIVSHEKPFCSVLRAGDELLSYNMGYIMGDVVYAFDAAYNREYAESQKIGLGILTYDNLVRKYAGLYKELDMGFGLDDYKFRFSKRVVFTYSLLMKGNMIKAAILYPRALSKQRQCERILKEKAKTVSDDT